MFSRIIYKLVDLETFAVLQEDVKMVCCFNLHFFGYTEVELFL